MRPARLVFSCGWHITLDGKDVYSRKLRAMVAIFGPVGRLTRFADLDDEAPAIVGCQTPSALAEAAGA